MKTVWLFLLGASIGIFLMALADVLYRRLFRSDDKEDYYR